MHGVYGAENNNRPNDGQSLSSDELCSLDIAPKILVAPFKSDNTWTVVFSRSRTTSSLILTLKNLNSQKYYPFVAKCFAKLFGKIKFTVGDIWYDTYDTYHSFEVTKTWLQGTDSTASFFFLSQASAGLETQYYKF